MPEPSSPAIARTSRLLAGCAPRQPGTVDAIDPLGYGGPARHELIKRQRQAREQECHGREGHQDFKDLWRSLRHRSSTFPGKLYPQAAGNEPAHVEISDQ